MLKCKSRFSESCKVGPSQPHMHTYSDESGQVDSLPNIAEESEIKSPIHAIDGGYITEWLVLGPFFPQDLNTDFLDDVGGEANIQPQEGDTLPTAEETPLTWRRYTAKGSIINLINAIGPHENATAYTFCILQSEVAGDAQIHLGSDDGVSVWINGKQAHSNPVNRNFILDEDVFEAELKVGANRCLIKVSQAISDWEFAMRVAILPKNRAVLSGVITDETGVPISNVDVRLEQACPRAKRRDGLVIAQTRTDPSGNYQMSIHPFTQLALERSEGFKGRPVCGTYDLSATKGEHGNWQLGIRLREGECRRLNLTLKEAISISGRLLMLDETTPHAAVPVQAICDGKMIATRLSDERGKYRFINLKPGDYQVRCQILGRYAYYGEEKARGLESQKAKGQGGKDYVSRFTHHATRNTQYGEILHIEPNKTLSNIDFRFAPFKKGTWKNYTSLDGLAHNVVITIYGAPDGMIWFGTEGGVSRYDGKEFITFTTENGLAGNIVYAIDCFVPRNALNGTMWFGTWDGGVSRYDGEKFITLTTEDGLASNRVVAIHHTPDSVMWFGTWGNGVSRYDGKKFITLTTEDGLASNWIHDIHHAPDGTMWFATSGGVSRYDGKEFVNITTEDGLAHNFVWSIYQTPDGVIWFATLCGVSRYDGKKFLNLTIKDGLAHNEVYAIYRTPDGAMWFGTQDGISCYDGKQITNYITEDGLAHNSVRSIHYSSDGAMWFGTRDGVSRYDRMGFVTFTTKDGLAHNSISAIHHIPDGAIWFATSGGVSCYDGEEFSTFTTKDGLASNWIHDIYCNPDGTMWFATSEGVSRYDGNQFLNFTTKDGLAYDRVFAIHHTSNGVLWFGTYSGLSRYGEKEFVTFTARDGLADNRVNAVYGAPDGTMWFGTRSGVSREVYPERSRRDGKKFLNFTTKDGLPHNEVYAIYRTPDGAMWFGTRGGVSRYDGKKFLNFTTKDGLASNWILAIHRDLDDIMWFGTCGCGVSMYDGVTWTSLDIRDGLTGNNVSSICQDSDGYLWFGTEGGITRYRRDTISPRACIIAVTTNRRYIDLDALEPAITGTRITFEYSSIDFLTHPEKRLYRYKLDGYDTDWSRPTKETQVDYADLPIGTYTFHVQALGRNLSYSESATIQVTVQPDPRDISLASLRTEVAHLRREMGRKYHFENIVGHSVAIKQVYLLMEKAIDSGLTILISGETGTGKELVAKAIHYNSPRKDQPLMVLNCGAIPKDLVASILFGHRKGAFTGAHEDKMGLFEAAFGGTLILDEIGEMPLQAQVNLLRVLQERKIQRIGETRLRDVDVRVIAITNRDLAREVQAGRFREDLYYRLNVFPIHLPPLRERLDTYHDRRNTYHFAVNPLGTLLDEKQGNLSWDGDWKAAVLLKPDCWTVEMQIPFDTLEFPKKQLQTWGINLARHHRMLEETSAWADTGVNVFRADRFGTLTGLKLDVEKFEHRTQITAYLAARSELNPEKSVKPTVAGFMRSGLKPALGADVAYRPSSNFSLFGTVHPDYSHVESEIQGIVLSDIEKRLTDRRPFFQEDGEIFYAPISLFYSRRIGEMNYGVKAMGKVGRFNFAMMNVQAQSPISNNLVFRAREDVAKASTLGLLYMGKEKPERYNRAVSLDSRFSLPFAARWSIAYARSWLPSVDGAGKSAFFSDIGRKGLPLSFSLTYRDVDANFTAENGYIPLKDIRQASLWALYSWRPVGTPLHSLNLECVGNRVWDHAGEVTRTERFGMVGFDFRGKLHTGIFRRDWTHDGYDNGLTAVQFLYNRQKPDHLFVIYSFGDFDGSKAIFTTFALNLIPHKTLAMGLRGESLRRRFPDGNQTHEISTRTSINYELGRDKWITFRIRLGTDNERNFNGVLKYTFTDRWVGYLVYGDQEAKQTMHRLFVKISATL